MLTTQRIKLPVTESHHGRKHHTRTRTQTRTRSRDS
jgi:hypothetical protein